MQDDALLDSLTKRIGFRTVELIQEPLEEPDKYGKGTTFLFEVNGVRMFMGGEYPYPPLPPLQIRTVPIPSDSLCLLAGSNWIPARNFLTTLTADDYRAWLTLLRDGNQNMVRLWGGGVYEPDVFYDICDGACVARRRASCHVVSASELKADVGPRFPGVLYIIHTELGVLVWQDFQFACGVYPAFDSFVRSVTAEAEDNVKRLRHHPSLALFCGNNEGAW